MIKYDLNKIYLGDARELIKQIPDGYCDICITDPPYSLNMDEFDNEES